MINLFLIIAHDLEGRRWAEFEVGATIQSDKRVAVEVESNSTDTSGCMAMMFSPIFGVVVSVADRRVGEDGGVELGGLGGLAVEPEAGDDVTRVDGHFDRY
jgi:hypothetical protein